MNDTSGKNLWSFLADQKQIWFDWFLVKQTEFKNKAFSFPVKIMMGNLDKCIIFDS